MGQGGGGGSKVKPQAISRILLGPIASSKYNFKLRGDAAFTITR